MASVWCGAEGAFLERGCPALRSSSSNNICLFADQRSGNKLRNQEAPTWSKQATKSSGSRFQVRKRVKAVLEKARTRTGIENTSSQKPSQVLAEAASVGGLGDGSVDFILQLSEGAKGHDDDASTESANSFADEAFLWQEEKENVSDKSDPGQPSKRSLPELDAIQADVPAAAKFCEPLPFTLPQLDEGQIKRIQDGERLQEQSRMGREGSGYVVFDVHAPPYVVWECLLDFESYPETIPTVREMQLFTNEKLNTGYVNEKPVLPGTGRETRHYGTPSVTRASFTLSKFRLKIAAIHKYTPHPDGDYMIFTLDPSCTNMVLKGARGTWYTESNPEGREVRTRDTVLSQIFARQIASPGP